MRLLAEEYKGRRCMPHECVCSVDIVEYQTKLAMAEAQLSVYHF